MSHTGPRAPLPGQQHRQIEVGHPLEHPPILNDIEVDPILAGTKIIAEAWDAAGLYQLADFGGDRWAVWNGQFRDHANGERDDVKGSGVVGEYPELAPGESFEYMSRCPLATRWGTMEGSYVFTGEDGTEFTVRIGRFFLVPSSAID